MFLNAPGSIAFSQEHFKTISYAKFGGQTECIMGNWKIVNRGFTASYRTQASGRFKLITNRLAWALMPTELVEPGNALGTIATTLCKELQASKQLHIQVTRYPH